MSAPDLWRLAEWEALPDECFIAACDASETDLRGPVWLRGGGMAKACTEHWEGIMRVLGEQVGSEDAYRSAPDPAPSSEHP
jgi:hypothetical protein